MKNLLCLDFDGVICDSIKECLLVTYNCFHSAAGESYKQAASIEEIPKDIRDTFYKYRYLVRPAKEYWLLMKLIHDGHTDLTEDIFTGNLAGNETILNEFEKSFFAYREDMIKNDFEFWIGLNSIYSQFSDFYKSADFPGLVYIVTNKNFLATDSILKSNNINIGNNCLYTREKFSSKENALRDIAEINNIGLDQIIFVDDSPATIKELSAVFPNCYLANWGYFVNSDNRIKSINNFSEILS